MDLTKGDVIPTSLTKIVTTTLAITANIDTTAATKPARETSRAPAMLFEITTVPTPVIAPRKRPPFEALWIASSPPPDSSVRGKSMSTILDHGSAC
jgi:hypothetical protein